MEYQKLTKVSKKSSTSTWKDNSGTSTNENVKEVPRQIHKKIRKVIYIYIS